MPKQRDKMAERFEDPAHDQAMEAAAQELERRLEEATRQFADLRDRLRVSSEEMRFSVTF